MLRAIAFAAALVALAPGVARGSSWSWPVRGRVVAGFSFSAADPYAPGRHRGIVIAARPGAPVLATCGGRVAFVGSVARAGPTLSVDCGSLRATYQGLAALAVRAGEPVAAGERIAALGSRGVLRLGARRTRGDYADPAKLLHAAPPTLGPAPTARVKRVRRAPPPPPVSLAEKAPDPTRVPEPTRAPPLAWLGLALLASAAPVSALWRRRGCRARRRPDTFRAWALRQLR